ncbi:hypothetical protein [Paracoccus sp. (in: a-proteobacteria)]|uniref:hypothetical protein n=1 Tax=Paracoccus sp. TaxID=267 RepID=UPI003A8A2C82
MQMVFHIGVHATDGDRLLKTLLNNRGWLLNHGTEVVLPNRHRGLFEEALMGLNGGSATHEMEQIMLDAILESESPRRVVFSTQTFMGAPGRAVTREGFYAQMGRRIAALSNLFPNAEAEFFVALRNPATLLTDVLQQFSGGDYTTLMQGKLPLDLRWRDPIQQLVQAAQGRRVVAWCHEDVLLIWPEVVRLIGNIPSHVPLSGALTYVQEVLDETGMEKLREALGSRDQMTVTQRRELQSAILLREAPDGAFDQEVDLPDWSQELVDQVTANYHQDVAEIAVLPGVEFILP